MRILLIRHGDPDYVHDSLTPEGKKEAEALAAIAPSLHVGTCYVSPLGRAQLTASYTLKKLGLRAETKDWLQEFPVRVDVENSRTLKEAYTREHMTPDGKYEKRIAWDMVPAYLGAHPEYRDPDRWRDSEVARMSDLIPLYDSVCASFDDLLASHGYERKGALYLAKKPNRETVTLFCHFGVSCVLLSHLFNMSPFVLWHSLCMAPASVTELFTEERQEGIACFRASRIGDISHLLMAGLTPSFSARFCECYTDDTRH